VGSVVNNDGLPFEIVNWSLLHSEKYSSDRPSRKGVSPARRGKNLRFRVECRLDCHSTSLNSSCPIPDAAHGGFRVPQAVAVGVCKGWPPRNHRPLEDRFSLQGPALVGQCICPPKNFRLSPVQSLDAH